MDFDALHAQLASAQNEDTLFKAIVNAPFANKTAAAHLGLGIIVLLLVDDTAQAVKRVALSDTPLADGAVRMSAKPFHDISIPLNYSHNYITQAILSGEPPEQVKDDHFAFMQTYSNLATQQLAALHEQ